MTVFPDTAYMRIDNGCLGFYHSGFCGVVLYKKNDRDRGNGDANRHKNGNKNYNFLCVFIHRYFPKALGAVKIPVGRRQ